MIVLEIRPAVEADIPALKRLLRRSWLTTWAPELDFEAVQRFAATDAAGNYAQAKWREFVVAADQGALLAMFHVEADHLHAIHIDPGFKRRGIGSLMMDEAERRISLGHPFATLEVLIFNAGAIAFYERRGWTRRRMTEIDESGQRVAAYEMIKVFPPK